NEERIEFPKWELRCGNSDSQPSLLQCPDDLFTREATRRVERPALKRDLPHRQGKDRCLGTVRLHHDDVDARRFRGQMPERESQIGEGLVSRDIQTREAIRSTDLVLRQ